MITVNVTYCLPGYRSHPGFGIRDTEPVRTTVYADPSKLVVDLARSPDSYRVKALCLNCKWEGQMRLPKGSLVTTKGHGVLCPKCGCKTVTGTSLIASETPETDSSKAVERAEAEMEERYQQLHKAWERRQLEPAGRRRR